ncbi:tetratricopeptide repeat domain 27 [Moniliophthora roreri MCA 2997]|uniref:Tetratricopeptide repeat domain 27 n=2 Tax=Moniliophthora roreri TaxID=221103 RepID=V2Z256_MONRO|nr:tetratricopeptide repeat domain 27 [Moniliophthora roreri MCA 2997]KAI3622069.1 tetratricopeptide repeat domain 27 [Moniliophthora roreri]
MDKCVPVEKCLLSGRWDVHDPAESPATNMAKTIVCGSFREALTSSYARQLFRSSSPIDLHNGIKSFFDPTTSLTEDEVESELIRLNLAIACLHAFVQANWTGPDLDVKPLDTLSDLPTSTTEDTLNQQAVSELAYGGEPAYHLTRVATFLRLARILLDVPYKHCQSVVWWRLRTHLVHQQVLDEPASLPEDVLESIEQWQGPFLAESAELAGRALLERGLLYHTFRQDRVAAECFVNASRATGLEYELTGALGKRTKFQHNDLSQLVLLAESHLPDDHNSGSTTSFPVENDSQPVVPETLALNDDTLLEQTEFTSSAAGDSPRSNRMKHLDPSHQPPLHPLDQCILLSLCLNVKNTSPLHGLTNEQMAPYISRVISHPRNWTIHTMALLLRSRLESTRTRTVERSTLQLQALVDQMPTTTETDGANSAPLSERLRYFHAISLPTRWEMERELAERYISLGVVKSAMEIFERLEMWEEVVKCHVSLERPDRGLAIVQELLEGSKIEAETVLSRGKTGTEDPAKRRRVLDAAREAKLWCLLGDLQPEKAAEHYNHGWQVSNHTSGRAMRSLGGYHFARHEYEEAKECLKMAVKINPLLSRSWFILGCACMRLEDWEGAKEAFGRCVAIDEEDGESWSNLASIYLRLEDNKVTQDPSQDSHMTPQEVNENSLSTAMKSVPHSNKLLAFRALKQGLKHSYENWRMWSNYMVIAVDVGELAEACRALGRIIQLTSNKSIPVVDEDVLDRLVNAITRAPSDPEAAASTSTVSSGESKPAINPNEGHGLLPRVLDLFERSILPHVSSARVYRAYARLMTWQSRWDDALKAWMDAYRESTAGRIVRGEADDLLLGETSLGEAAAWKEAVSEVEEIVDVLRNLGPRIEGGSSKKWRLQARSLVKSFMSRTRDNFEDVPDWERLETTLEELKQDTYE